MHVALERTATVVRTLTVVVAVTVGSSVLALHEFDRSWGSGPLGTGTSVDVVVVELGRVCQFARAARAASAPG